jgi:legumain
MGKAVFGSVLVLLALTATSWSAVRFPRHEGGKLASGGKIWVLLVAGSNGYENYRHQADVCHAYQVVHAHGIPDEQIIVMMYDDIANSSMNPTPGIIINEPDGQDVYAGVPKDYTKKKVTPEIFLSLLTGESALGVDSGKLLNSGPNDHVFVYFSDHGAEGLIAFPSEELFADDLRTALKAMHEANRFEKLVFYLESCESGSMFRVLHDDIDVFATTASSPWESSYAVYYDDTRETYLGDEYSVNWMQDSDAADFDSETLQDQFTTVKNVTIQSTPHQYGNTSISSLLLSEFQGQGTSTGSKANKKPIQPKDKVSSRDVHINILHKKIAATTSEHDKHVLKAQLRSALKDRLFVYNTVKSIVKEVVSSEEVSAMMTGQTSSWDNFPHYKNVVSYFSKKCFSLAKNSYALQYAQVFANIVNHGVQPVVVRDAMDRICTHHTMVGIN